MKQTHSLSVAGTTLLLLPEKAAYWPEQKTLLIADAHFGKAAAYRALGQPVPRGTTAANLQKLDRLLTSHDCHRIIFLGDFLHGPGSGRATHKAIAAWRARHPNLECILIRGNHDSRAGDPASELRIDILDEPYLLGPFALCHNPTKHPTHHVIAGHVHPAYRLSGRAKQSLTLPCFSSSEGITLLPSFGGFTGSYVIDCADGDQVFVTNEEFVWQIKSIKL
ncbi:MAG TPA: ligase-associated DNA damage response endonuclease PdeM [Methylophilaceae bacterium]|nr:ligase-associated DNA damage response endonuclease PdeM [Methylophilaceae bacterium]